MAKNKREAEKEKEVEESEEEEEEAGEGVADSSDDSDEEEEDTAMHLDAVLDGENEDIDIFFDDPQEKHTESMQVILRKSPLGTHRYTRVMVSGACVGVKAADALANIAACDPESVGTVAGSSGEGEEFSLFCFCAVVRLDHYKAGKRVFP